jgi:hypothetical protein
MVVATLRDLLFGTQVVLGFTGVVGRINTARKPRSPRFGLERAVRQIPFV